MKKSKRRVAVRITLEAVASLLHLREGLEVVAVRTDLDTGEVRVLIEGEELPPLPRRCEPVCVSILELMDFDL